jgi:spoIIIJ-associated protein
MEEPRDIRLDEIAEDDETEFATVADAATVDEAKRKALDQLRKVVPYVNERDVEFLVVEEGTKGGLFGRGKMLAQVEARLLPSDELHESETPPGAEAEALREFVQTAVRLMGIEASVSVHETPTGVRADIAGDDLGLLIGRHGSTIDALQCIAAIAVNGDRRDRLQVIIDAQGYRGRRELALSSLADRTAQKVAREGGSVTLQHMSAAERKVIHLHLKDDTRVETASEGSEPFRAVVISRRSAE